MTEERGSGRIELVAVSQLQAHPLNAEIYGIEDVSDLIQAITESGHIDPLSVIQVGENTYQVLRGHRRLQAAKQLQLTKLPCTVLTDLSEEETLIILLTGNVQREKTIEVKVREAWLWEEIYKSQAKSRMGKKGAGQGAARDLIAKQVGLGSGVTYERASAVIKAMEDGHPMRDQIKEIVASPTGKVSKAYKLIQPTEEDKEKTFTSVAAEVKDKQKKLGLGASDQVFPDSDRNQGDPREMDTPVACLTIKKPAQPMPEQYKDILKNLRDIQEEARAIANFLETRAEFTDESARFVDMRVAEMKKRMSAL
jgi:ParB family chromosome partitioning protein